MKRLSSRRSSAYHGPMPESILSILTLAGPCAGGALTVVRDQIRGSVSASGKFGLVVGDFAGERATTKPARPKRKMAPVMSRVCRGIARTALGRRSVAREQRSLEKSIVHPIGREIPRKFSLDFHRKRRPIATITARQSNPARTCVLKVVKPETTHDSISSVLTRVKPG